MSKKQEPLRVDLRNLLARGGRPVNNLSSDGKVVPVPDEAELFQFDFIKDGENYGKVYVTIDGLHQLVVYFDDKVARSPKNGSTDSESWEQLVRTLKRFATQNQLSFQLSDQDNLENDMAKREYTKKQERVFEGYHAMGKKASYNDSVPTTKMIIKHTRNIEEGEQRYRNVEKIFIENSEGERFLAPTTRPGLARVYARHIAEGGKVNDERWGHINGLCEEYNKMAGFVRATRNGQFNESAQRLVTEGVAHYQKLRECLSKMAGRKGYNNYFESWTPPLMEAEETVDLSEMFMTASLDPRIESVMPILGKLSKNLGEARDMEETIALENWADEITTHKGGKITKTPTGIKHQAGPDNYGGSIPDEEDFKEPDMGAIKKQDDALGIKWKKDKKWGGGINPDLDEGEKEADYGADYQDMVSRVGQKAKAQDAKKSPEQRKADLEKLAQRLNKPEKEVEEGLDSNQTSAGQLGPTEPVGKGGPRGKLVGAMESTDPLARLLKLAK